MNKSSVEVNFINKNAIKDQKFLEYRIFKGMLKENYKTISKDLKNGSIIRI
jgi:hypothetical protein